MPQLLNKDNVSLDVVASSATMLVDIARALVDDPQRVAVQPVPDEGTTTLILKVGDADLGKVIGKHGRTAKSLRILLGALARRAGHRLELDIRSHEPSLRA